MRYVDNRIIERKGGDWRLERERERRERRFCEERAAIEFPYAVERGKFFSPIGP